MASQLGNIGNVWQTKREPDKALEYLEQALAIHREAGYRHGAAIQLGNIGLLLVDIGRHAQAVTRLLEALDIFRSVGAADGPQQCLEGLRACLKALERDRFLAACEEAGKSKEEAEKLADQLLAA